MQPLGHKPMNLFDGYQRNVCLGNVHPHILLPWTSPTHHCLNSIMWTFSLISSDGSHERRADIHHLLGKGHKAFKKREGSFFHSSLTTLYYTVKVVHGISIICSFLKRIKIEDDKINAIQRHLYWTADSIHSRASILSRILYISLLDVPGLAMIIQSPTALQSEYSWRTAFETTCSGCAIK